MHDEAVLRAVVEYARCGDAGALRYLRSHPFGAWARRAAQNVDLGSEADGAAPPPELVTELTDALRRLEPSERQALEEALSRLVSPSA